MFRWCVLFWAAVTVQAYLNEFDKPLTYHCPHPYQSIQRVQSIHNNHDEDRRFDLTCANIATNVDELQTTCFWSNYVNAYDHPVNFDCPTSNYISGMASVHNNHYEDRQWRYYCCRAEGFHLLDCSNTGYTNEYDQDQDYTVPSGMVMKGAYSEHSNHNEDRRFGFEVCTIKPETAGVVG